MPEPKQFSLDRLSLIHAKAFKEIEELKKAGRALAQKSMAIDITFARQKDRELFEKVKIHYNNPPQDPAQKQEFEEELKLVKAQFSGQHAAILYEIAVAFCETLPFNDPDLKLAKECANLANLLAPNANTIKLADRLKNIR